MGRLEFEIEYKGRDLAQSTEYWLMTKNKGCRGLRSTKGEVKVRDGGWFSRVGEPAPEANSVRSID